MIKGFIRTGYSRETLFGESMKCADVLKCTARFALNEVDGADLTLPATNRPGRSLLQKNAVVELRNDSETVFIGDVATVLRNELGDIQLELDGALGWLRCVCKAPFTIKPTDPNGPVENFLAAIFSQYNAAVPTERQLQLGSVTVTGGVSMDHSGEYVSMLDLLREVREQRGGYLYVDYVTGLPTVHYVASLSQVSAQTLEFGANVLTVEDQLDFTDYASHVYATGTYYVTTTVDGQEKREQKPVDAGYVSDADAEALYGRADLSYRSDTDMGGDKDNDIPDKTQAEAIAIIQAEAQAILDERKVPLRSLDMTAVELAEIGADYRLFKVGTVARALVQILNINTTLAVRSVKRDFIDAGNSTVSFGKEAATISGASFGGGGSASGGSSGGSGQVGPQGPAGPQGPQGVQGPQGPAGADGEDGVSPTVTVTTITGGHRVTITDASGTTTFDVMDGSSSSGSDNAVAMTKTNGVWQLDSSGMWRTLWSHFDEEIRLITVDGTDVRHLYKTSLEYTSSSSITSVDLYFSDQRYNSRTAEGKAFKLTVPETGNGTITEITAANIPTSGGGGSGLPAIQSGDKWKFLRVTFEEDGVEWASDNSSHMMFYIDEDTLAITDSGGQPARGAALFEACQFYSVVIFGTERNGNDRKFNLYHPMENNAPDGSRETVQFFRPSSDGIVVLSIQDNKSTATKTTIPFGGSGGSAENAVLYTAQSLTDSQKLQARQNIGADTLTVSIVDNGEQASPRYTLPSGVTPSAIMNRIPNVQLHLGTIYELAGYQFTGPIVYAVFFTLEVNSQGGLDVTTISLSMNTSTNACTITKRSKTDSGSGGSSGGRNLIYDYVTSGSAHFLILRGAESPTSGNMIISNMESENAVPVVFVQTYCYYYYGQDSESVIFRRLDNVKQVKVDKTTGAATESNV